jgi:DNA-directed RNA polymerase subunit L
MRVSVLKKTSNELRLEVEGAGHTLCSLLQKKLLEEKNTDMAGYDIPHPLASNAIIYLRTRGAVKPEQVVRNALENARELNKEFSKEFARAVREK